MQQRREQGKGARDGCKRPLSPRKTRHICYLCFPMFDLFSPCALAKEKTAYGQGQPLAARPSGLLPSLPRYLARYLVGYLYLYLYVTLQLKLKGMRLEQLRESPYKQRAGIWKDATTSPIPDTKENVTTNKHLAHADPECSSPPLFFLELPSRPSRPSSSLPRSFYPTRIFLAKIQNDTIRRTNRRRGRPATVQSGESGSSSRP
jgi:hypothetical protein